MICILLTSFAYLMEVFIDVMQTSFFLVHKVHRMLNECEGEKAGGKRAERGTGGHNVKES